MTTYTQPLSAEKSQSWPLYAALAAGSALVLTAIGTFWAPFGSDTGPAEPMEFFAFNVPVVLVGTAVIFGLVARTADESNAPRRGMVLAVLGLLSIVGFWTGLPSIFALGAVSCVTTASTGTPSRSAIATYGIAAVTLALAVWLALAG